MSQTWPFPHKYIAIEGNIGAGKTTLCEMIARDFSCRMILEEFTDNPFLSLFYNNPERYAFPVELFFMTERHKQLQQELGLQDLFKDSVISDYFFLKTLLFAGNNLNEEEFRLFSRLFQVLNNTFPKPDLLLYLHRPIPALLQNIEKRNRQFETDISPDYLIRIQNSYMEFFRSEDGIPIVILKLDDRDFESEPLHYEIILEVLKKSFLPGVHYLEVHDGATGFALQNISDN